MINRFDLAMRVMVLVGMSLLLGCSSTASDRENLKSARVHTELAGLYFERSQFGVALDEIDKALKSDRQFAPAYSVRGLIHMALHEDELAEEDFKKSLDLDRNDSDTHNNYGWFLCQRDREKEAIPHFMAAVKNPLYQTPGLAFLNAGLCSIRMGKNKDGEDFLQRALATQPDMPQALLAMAEMKFSAGDYVAAKKYFSGFSQGPDYLTAEQLWLAVRIERKNHDKNSEASYALQLRKRFPDAPETELMMSGK